MSSIVLGSIGSAVGSVFGPIGSFIGGAIGTAVGSAIDSALVSALSPSQNQTITGQRLESLEVTTATEGAVIPRVYGRMRVGGNIIWATDFREEVRRDKQGGGKGVGGGGGSVTTVTYLYFASFAVAVCEGPITGIGRIWADGELLNLEGVSWRWYSGDETQEPDPFIQSKMGADRTPAYRGTAYVVFEELGLETFGNRIPQLTFEVYRAIDADDAAEGLVTAVTMIPGSGEYIYGTEKVTRNIGNGATAPENVHAQTSRTDFLESLDRLEAALPNVESISLVVSWFGDDLRCGSCDIRPGVEDGAKNASVAWRVAGVLRNAAYVVSSIDGRPAYGGTPSDASVLQAIAEMKTRGQRVTFYPFVLMDVPEGNTLPNPYSNNAAGSGQPTYPWRGRITVSPAAGFTGTVDKTATAATQVAAFFGTATPAHFGISNGQVTYSGPAEWSYRRMILHYAKLCALAGGVDTFIIGSELRALTQARSAAGTYPTVAQLQSLAADCRTILGSGVEISYAADWSEYFGHHPADGTGDVYFHLDPLWAHSAIDFVGIDNYMPLSDWRDGYDHLDAQDWQTIYDVAYLRSNIEGGEGFDWYYANGLNRTLQVRTTIADGAYGEPWVFRYKDIRSWWSNAHHNRPGGVRSGTPTAWVPESKPIRFTEFGCPAVDRGTNQPNVFFDPKSSESFVPYFSRGWRDDAIQRSYIEAVLGYWGDNANNPSSSVYAGRMLDVAECAVWTWDARPYPFFPNLADVWGDAENWQLGHWVSGRLGSSSLAALVRQLCLDGRMDPAAIDVTELWGSAEGYTITNIESPRASIEVLMRHFGFDAVETQGRIAFRMRGRAPVLTVDIDDLVAGENGDGFELTRGQETELPQALKWTVRRADEEYDSAQVEARRITVLSSRIASESFAIAVPPEEAERRVRRALQELWVAREKGSFGLPPSTLALDPTDVVTLMHDGRGYDFRLVEARDGLSRAMDAVAHDREVYDLPPGATRATTTSSAVVFGGSLYEFMDLPQLNDADSDYRPLLAVYARPWPGDIAVFRSPEEDGFSLLATTAAPAFLGSTAATFLDGPLWRFDHANALVVDMISGTFESKTDLQLFGGENVIAVQTGANQWEIVQAGEAELVSPGRYRLTKLLRGQRGTEDAMVASLAPGARVVVLDSALLSLPVDRSDVGIPFNWLLGPASLPFTDDAYQAAEYTPLGRGLRPFSPVNVAQPWRTARVPGNYTISWNRRARQPGADSWAAVEIALGEDSEAYEVDIMNGGTVVRTLSTATTSVVYTGAQQTTDWGGYLAAGDTLEVRIYQLSPTYGRGTPAIVTLQF